MMSSLPTLALLNALDTALALLNADGSIQHASPALLSLCGHERLEGMRLEDALGAAVRWEDGAATVSAFRPDGMQWEARLSRHKLEGVTLIRVASGPSAAQLAALTRKFSHDINNQLQVIAISGGTLIAGSTPGSPDWEDATEICDAVEKAHQQLSMLQRHARSVPSVQKPAPVTQVSIDADATTILLVDNSEIVREAAVIVLERSGYQATAISNADAALDLFASGVMRWSLVILSMELNHTSGIRLAQMLHRLQPDLPVLLCIASGQEPSDAECKAAGITAIIQKPFSHTSLLDAVAAAVS
ncbi:MAG: response regulator [Myxococcota bacterium]|nr:response regulator [Myxococcota bacterium]